MAKAKKLEGLDISLGVVPQKDSGALYQLVEGDPTNSELLEKMAKSAAKAAEEA